MAHLQCAVKPPTSTPTQATPCLCRPRGRFKHLSYLHRASRYPGLPKPVTFGNEDCCPSGRCRVDTSPAPHTHQHPPIRAHDRLLPTVQLGQGKHSGAPAQPHSPDPASPLPNTSAHPHCPQEALGLSSGPDTLVRSLRDKAGHAEGVRAPARPASTATGKCGEPSRRSLSVGPGRGPWRHRAPPKTQAKPREAQPLTHTTG